MSQEITCAVCGTTVPFGQQSEHLAAAHPPPLEGWPFWFDGRPYRSDVPSMIVAELLVKVGASTIYRTKQIVGTGDARREFDVSHDQAVDLTQQPQFFAIPPARM